LTGIANRRRLVERGTEEWQRSRRFGTPMAVLAMDLDHFKQINDTHGHAMGDTVLRAAAQAFSTEIRDVDFIARAGGEEFVVILAGAETEVAEGIAERLRRTMESLPLFSPDDKPLTVTTSIGLAVLGKDESFEALWHRADTALYQAKNDGRNRVALAA
jgi:diguanylate cyclase (GGDEF)-like protein